MRTDPLQRQHHDCRHARPRGQNVRGVNDLGEKTFLKGEAMELRSKDGRILTTRKLVDAEDNAVD